jgi:glycosyltransferase involved in cell wall biosynthesis
MHEPSSPNPVCSTNPIRVLIIMEAFSVTGPAKNLIEFARLAASPSQSRLRVKISVATFDRGNYAGPNRFVLACRQAGVSVHVIPERAAFDFGVIAALRKLISECDPHIVQTHSVKSHFLMRLTSMYRQRHWVAFHHGYTSTNLKVTLYNQLDRWSLPAASRVVTVCRPFASALAHARVHTDRITIRHNSVKAFLPAASDKILELRRMLRIPVASQVLLTVGRLSREKGHIDLLQALSLLRESNAIGKLHLIIVGDGPEKQRLLEAASRYQVAPWVSFVGHQVDVAPYYTMADLMVLPSHTEGSPNVLLEAMAAGLPIVATSVGGVPEIVTNGKQALLVEKSNHAALASAITRLLDDANLRAQISRFARTTASAYSPAEYCNSMLSLYSGCLAQHPPCAAT